MCPTCSAHAELTSESPVASTSMTRGVAVEIDVPEGGGERERGRERVSVITLHVYLL